MNKFLLSLCLLSNLSLFFGMGYIVINREKYMKEYTDILKENLKDILKQNFPKVLRF
jgi:hypothetical protein